jgi:hypothetical protein
MKHLNWLMVLILVSIGISSCDTGSKVITDWCSGITLESNKGAPGDKIGIKGIPNDLTSLFAYVTVQGSNGESAAIIEQNEQGANYPFSLVVPIHPIEHFAGGKVNVEVSNGEKRCSPIETTVTSIGNPDSSEIKGAFAKTISQLQQSLSAEAASVGISVEQLKGDLSELPQEFLLLGINQFLIDHPDNPNSLTSLATRQTILLEDEFVSFDVGWLDVLFHHFQLGEFVNESKLQVASVVSLSENCIGQAALATAAQLNFCMLEQKNAEKLERLAELVSKIAALTSMILILDPVPGDEAFFAVVSGYSFIVGLGSYVAAQIFPKELASLTFEVSTKRLNWIDQSGQWLQMRVSVADTKGVDIIKVLSSAIDQVPIPFEKLLKKFPNIVLKDRKLPVPEEIKKLLAKALENWKSLLIDKVSKAFNGKTNFPPIQYSTLGFVDITDFREGYDVTIDGDNVKIKNIEDNSYEPAIPLVDGTSNVTVRIKPEYFNNYSGSAKQAVEVKVPTVVYEGNFTASGTVMNGDSVRCPGSVPVNMGGKIIVRAYPDQNVELELLVSSRVFGPYCFSYTDSSYSITGGKATIESFEPLRFSWKWLSDSDTYDVSIRQSELYGTLIGDFINHHHAENSPPNFSNNGFINGNFITGFGQPE